MKKPTYEEYKEFVSNKKKELSDTSLVKNMPELSKRDLLYGRLIIEVYNKFLKKKKEEEK